MLLGVAASVDPIAAVIVRLSAFSGAAISLVMVKLSLAPLIMASSVGLISAVSVRLSLGHGHSAARQTGVGVSSRMGVASISYVVLDMGFAVSTSRAGPQETKNNKIRLAGKNRTRLGYFFLTMLYLVVTDVWLFIGDNCIEWFMC